MTPLRSAASASRKIAGVSDTASHSTSLATRDPIRPPLKWAGGKRWQLRHLRPLWEAHRTRRLVEPFCGGLAVTIGLMPDRALLNDVNPHIINFYRWVQRGLSIRVDFSNDSKTYYAFRRRFNALLEQGGGESAEAASMFYYLNRTGYNGLCRFNQKGAFNVPFGRYAKIGYKSDADFSVYVEPFSRFEFVSMDFESLPLEADDFVYADPPYDVAFRQYSKDGFGWDEQVRAAEWLAGHRGPVVLSNEATRRIVRLYETLGYTLKYLSGPRQISCTGDRTPAREVLAIRNL